MAKSIISKETCPMNLGINVLGGKWKLQIIWTIQKNKIVRFNELQRTLGEITTKTLTSQLRELEEMKIIKRKVFAEVPPHVEYSLTEIGESIEPILNSLCDWGKKYIENNI